MSFWYKKQIIANKMREWITRPLLFVLALTWKNFNRDFGNTKNEIFVMISFVRYHLRYKRFYFNKSKFEGNSYTDLRDHTSYPSWWDKFLERKQDLENMIENRYHEDYEGEDDRAINAQAMDHAIAFAKTLSDYKLPTLFIHSNGEPRLIWVNKKDGSGLMFNEQVGILFRESGKVNYVFFRDDNFGNDDVTSIGGHTHIEMIMPLIRQVGLEHVMKE